MHRGSASSPALAALRAMCHPDGRIALFNGQRVWDLHEPRALWEYAGVNVADATGAFCIAGQWLLRARDRATGRTSFATPARSGRIISRDNCAWRMLLIRAVRFRASGDCPMLAYTITSPRLRNTSLDPGATTRSEIDARTRRNSGAFFERAAGPCEKRSAFEPRQDGFDLSTAHDGYARLPGPPIHHRRFAGATDDRWNWKIRFRERWQHAFVSRLHLHRIAGMCRSAIESVRFDRRAGVRDWSSRETESSHWKSRGIA